MINLDESLRTPSFAYFDASTSAIDQWANQFQSAAPFPYVEIPNFLTRSPEEILPHFPPTTWPGWSKFRDSYQHKKMFCNELELLPPPIAGLIQELSLPAFLRFLERVTGIPKLIPDPYLEGGGLHCSGPGGILAPHTDFHRYERLGLFRRINVIVYLNQEWEPEYGGLLELYRQDHPEPDVSVLPRWGTCVIFQTDDNSTHGFSKPILGDRWRRSIALYYYTSAETTAFSGDADTHWKSHGSVGGVSRLRLVMYRSLMFGSRSLSRVAHRLNPHLGSNLVPVAGLSKNGSE